MKWDNRRDPRFDRVRVAGLQSYLLNRGWKHTPFPRSEFLRFEEPVEVGTEPVVQFVPATEKLTDFPLRVEDVVTTLSRLEDRPVGDILDDILASNVEGIPLSLDTEVRLTMPEARAEG
jgi:hypothetical protein